MKLKRAIRYLRISTDRQSNFSIDGQDMATRHWCERNNVEIVDTFTDEGYSARNFDRPDMNRLNAFISKHYRTIDYLIVNAYDRFSRDAGEALVAIKKLQKQFGVSVVSVNEGVIFDGDDPGSFFYAGLMLLKGEDEIIRNRSRINMGIYQAKKMQGRYLGAAPFGYKNTRDEHNKPIIVIDENRAPVIRYVFEAFLSNTPLYEIYRHACAIGLTYRGNGSVTKILKCPVYTGLIHVKAYKNYPEELVEGIHEAIINRTDWNQAQEKLSGRSKYKTQLTNEDLPLRGVLKCHCGKALTGAASTGRHGGRFYYYKCATSGHNTINVKRAHAQFQEVLKYMSLPERLVSAIRDHSEEQLEQRLKENTSMLRNKRNELEEANKKLTSVEEKWINNQMSFDTYQRWYSDLTNKRMSLSAQIDNLRQDQQQVWTVLYQQLDKLTDMQALYNSADTLQKQQIVRLGFDSQLYYKSEVYRTPYILPVFSHNSLILKEKNLLIVEQKRGLFEKVPSGGAEQPLIEPLSHFLSYISAIKIA
jgi:DNA invertase Pin-like site-specific DNA recombinase